MRISGLTGVAAFAAVAAGCSPLRERASSPSCLSDSLPQLEALNQAYVLAKDSRLSLPAFDSAAVSVIRSDSLCRSASISAFGAKHHQQVVLVALGTSGYFVFASPDQARDRGLRCFTAILDRRLKPTLMGCDLD